MKYLRRAEELSNVETDGDTQIKKRAHKRPSRFESDTEDGKSKSIVIVNNLKYKEKLLQ